MPLFGITNVADLASKPTLGFAVDDTGSMLEEIKSVQKLIHSFIKTERSEPKAYILTTFNDPGKSNPTYCRAGMFIRVNVWQIAKSKVIDEQKFGK